VCFDLIYLLPLQAFKGWVDHDIYDDYITTSALGNAEGFLDNTVF
jgi:hypothetical protein